MVSWIKRIIILVSAILALLIVIVIALPFIIDPNDYKGRIQQLAADQGLQLELGGPIGWQFFPNLGLSLNQIVVAPLNEPAQPLAQIGAATAAVAVLPLFKKQLRVEKLLVDGATINLVVDSQGRGNWEALSQEEQPNATELADTQTSVTTNLDLRVNSIRLSNATLIYDNKQTGERSALRELDLDISDVNTQQQPFPLDLNVMVENPTLTKPLRVALKSQLAVNSGLNQFNITEGTLSLPDAEVELQLSTNANIENDPRFDGTLNATVSDLSALFNVLGMEQPTTADPSVLAKVAFNSVFKGDTQTITVPELSIKLDDTNMKGNLALNLPTEKSNLTATVNLRGDKINIDRYLAPATEETAVATETAAADSPLPLEALRSNDATLNFQFDEIIVNQMPITQLDLAVNGKSGLWQLQKFNAGFYQGKLTSKGQLDARSDQAQANFNADLNGLALEPLLTDLADIKILRGSVQAKVGATTQATTTQQLMTNLVANATFSGDSLLIDGFNIEQQYCELVDQIKAGAETEQRVSKTWPQQTTINAVSGRITMVDSLITVEQLQAQVAYLLLGAKGKLQLQEQDYEISLPLKLTHNQTSENGCLVASEFLINREINVLGCKGNLEALNPAKQCGLRSGAVSDLAKQAVRYNFERRGGNEKIDAAKEETKEKVDDKKQEVRDKAKDKLKDLLKR